MFTGFLWYLAMPFYHQCKKITPGMSISEVEQLMGNYINNNRVEFYKGELHMSAKTALEGEGMGFYTKSLDMRCQMTTEEEKIKAVEFYYD
jgi:hypothetical protein